MGVTVKVDDRKIRKALQGLSDTQIKKILRSAGESLLRRMRQRVEDKGIGSDGKKMPKYSKPYKAVREKAGKTATHRSLHFSGKTHGARKVLKVRKDQALLGWSPGTEQAVLAQVNEKRTPWIQPTKDEHLKTQLRLRKAILEAVKTGKAKKATG